MKEDFTRSIIEAMEYSLQWKIYKINNFNAKNKQ